MKRCPQCAQENPDDAIFCQKCGWQAPASGAPETSGLAVGSLISGILFFFFPAAVLAIVLGHLSRSEIRRSGGRKKGAGMALAGLIFGYFGVAIIPIVLIVAAIAIPNLLRAKMAANEATAVGSLRAINTAIVSYSSQYGHVPGKLTALAPPAVGPQTENFAGLIDTDLAHGQKSGYVFSYEASDSQGRGIYDAYVVYADPVTSGTTGQRHFFTDQTGVIRSSTMATANEHSPPL